MDVENIFELVGGICLNVRTITVLGRLIKVVVLLDETLQLCLHVRNLVLRKLVLVQRDFSKLEVLEETQFRREEEKQCTPLSADSACRPPYAVNVFLGLIWRVILYNPVYFGYVEAPRGHISTYQHCAFSLAKLEESRSSLLLFLFAIKTQHGYVDKIEEIGIEFHSVTTGHEDNDLPFQVTLEKGEQEEKPSLRRNGDKALFETLHRGCLLLIMNPDVHRLISKRDAN
mmetsp:Transcript_13634/g.27921  ORF Transcript_13634/g.27921 Transcript_13634/m.27921 type:complete len:229 (+) Transcript_13634:2210-2896(+)